MNNFLPTIQAESVLANAEAGQSADGAVAALSGSENPDAGFGEWRQCD
jgi:hypothetical protein